MSANLGSGVIAQLAKAPLLGKVKTRMQPFLSEAESVQLHQALTEYIVASLSGATACRYELWCSEPHAFFDQLRKAYAIVLQQQVEGDLGGRLSAIAQRHAGNPTILIGSDCPFIDTGLTEAIFSHLSTSHDLVIVPASDGGYVALGCRAFWPELFLGIDWGTARVYEQTVRVAERLGLHIITLPTSDDIDRPSDLPLLARLGISLNLAQA